MPKEKSVLENHDRKESREEELNFSGTSDAVCKNMDEGDLFVDQESAVDELESLEDRNSSFGMLSTETTPEFAQDKSNDMGSHSGMHGRYEAGAADEDSYREKLQEIREKGIPRSLKWLRWKFETGSTEYSMLSAMQLAGQEESMYKMNETLRKSGLKLSRIDICSKGHVAFAGEHQFEDCCPLPACRRWRKETSSRSKSTISSFEHFDLEDYVRSWLMSETYSTLMKYRHKESFRSRERSKSKEEHWITDYVGGTL